LLGADYVQVRKKHIGNTGECSGEAEVKTVGWGRISSAVRRRGRLMDELLLLPCSSDRTLRKKERKKQE
jgi:hypothetical protein